MSSWRECAESLVGSGVLCLVLVVAVLVSIVGREKGVLTFSPGETQTFSASKKKKKQEKIENPPTEVVFRLDPETSSVTYQHGCCSCSLWHRVTHTLVRLSGDDEPLLLGIRSVWVVDSEMTNEQRAEMSCRDLVEIFGSLCFRSQYTDPLGMRRTDRWELRRDPRGGPWSAEGDPFRP